MDCLVTGAGGFIGGHLVNRLIKDGHTVRAVDIKPLEDWWQTNDSSSRWFSCDLRQPISCVHVCDGVDRIYNLACDMGGIGFITENKADCMVSVLINTNLLREAVANHVRDYFYSVCLPCRFAKYYRRNTSQGE